MTICLFADGMGEGRGQIDVPGLPDINAKNSGRIELSGDVCSTLTASTWAARVSL